MTRLRELAASFTLASIQAGLRSLAQARNGLP
jgi:hypothetical protein